MRQREGERGYTKGEREKEKEREREREGRRERERRDVGGSVIIIIAGKLSSVVSEAYQQSIPFSPANGWTVGEHWLYF